jgi:phage repressor protein C with HTH and peptisase S24 domain
MSEEGEQLFQELMRFRPDGLTANGWAVKAGVSRTIWADLRRHGNPSRRTLEKLLGAAGSSLAEFEALRVIHPAELAGPGEPKFAERDRGWRGAPPAALPLLAASLAGEWEQEREIALHSMDRSTIVGRVDRPAALASDPDAYAVTMVGESMWPRFRAGRGLLVSPAAPVEAGDDVLVRLAGDKVMIKELVRRSAAKVGLRQFNPDKIFSLDAAEIAAIHKILGEAIE